MTGHKITIKTLHPSGTLGILDKSISVYAYISIREWSAMLLK